MIGRLDRELLRDCAVAYLVDGKRVLILSEVGGDGGVALDGHCCQRPHWQTSFQSSSPDPIVPVRVTHIAVVIGGFIGCFRVTVRADPVMLIVSVYSS